MYEQILGRHGVCVTSHKPHISNQQQNMKKPVKNRIAKGIRNGIQPCQNNCFEES